MDNWTWGLLLIAPTIAVHATGVTFLMSVLRSLRVRLESRRPGLPHVIAIVVAAFTAMGLLLVGIEAALLCGGVVVAWRARFAWSCVLYSVDSIATRGGLGVTLQPHWAMMGALEAADGRSLFGISTAFIFTVMQFYYRHLVLLERPGRSNQSQISLTDRSADA